MTHRINLALPLPRELFYLAFSGGVDSAVALDFLLAGGRKPKIIYFNHGTEHGQDAQEFVYNQCMKFGLDLTIRTMLASKDPSESQEEYWRNERYKVFHNLAAPVITAHHLDDSIETYLFTALIGNGRVMPLQNKNVIRPFMFTTKDDIKAWANKNQVEYIQDPSNDSRKYMRNIIRHDIMQHALKINPGLHKMIRKKYNDNNCFLQKKAEDDKCTN